MDRASQFHRTDSDGGHGGDGGSAGGAGGDGGSAGAGGSAGGGGGTARHFIFDSLMMPHLPIFGFHSHRWNLTLFTDD